MLALWTVLDNVLSPAQLFMTPTDYNLPGFSVHGISQARILEQVAISFSKGSSQPRDWIHVSCVSSIGKQILYHWATGEALVRSPGFVYLNSLHLCANPMRLVTGLPSFIDKNNWNREINLPKVVEVRCEFSRWPPSQPPPPPLHSGRF